MAWVSLTFMRVHVGTAAFNAVVPSQSVHDQFELGARATVLSVLQHAGYDSPGDTLTDGTAATGFLRKLCAAQLFREACGSRKGIRMPAAVTDGLELLAGVYEKRLPVPGMTPSVSAGYGGTVVSPSTGTSARPAQFTRAKLAGF